MADDRVVVVAPSIEVAHAALTDVDPSTWRYVAVRPQVRGVTAGTRYLVLEPEALAVAHQWVIRELVACGAVEVHLLDLPATSSG